MRIGIFTDCYYPQINGVVTSTMTLKKELEKMGHKVVIVTVKHPDAQKEDDVLRLPSIPFLLLRSQRVGAVYSNKVYRQIKELNLDIIHTQTEFSLGHFGRIVARRFNIPVIHTYHTMYEDYMHYVAFGPMLRPASHLAKKVSKSYCGCCRAVIAPTLKVKNKLIEYGLVDKNIEVIPTGIDFEPFRKDNFDKKDIDDLKASYGIKKDEKVVLFIGRIAKEKSIDVIIKSMKELERKMDNFKFLIVGDGPEKSELESLAKSLGMQNRVVFAGEKPWKDIPMYYQLGDVFVSASVTETQGLTFTEAMASSVPVVAKYDENLENIMKDKINGLIFKTDEELTGIIFEVLNNEILRNRIIKGAEGLIEDMSAKHFGENVARLYEKVINENDRDQLKEVVN